MAGVVVPDLGRLLAGALAQPPDREPARALRVAQEHRLPLALTAVATGLGGSPDWAAAVAAERGSAAVRAGTLEGVRRALGAIASEVAVAGPPWRPVLGSDVDLLVPAARLTETVDRLTAAGLLEVGWHAGPGRAALVRTAGGAVVDLVDVEVVDPSALEPPDGRRSPGAPPDLARLRPEAEAARLARSVAARGVVRLRDLADVESLGPDRPDVPSDPSARSGWSALRAASLWLERAPMPRPLSLGELGVRPSPRRRLRSPDRSTPQDRWRRGVRVTLRGPGAADRAATVTASLRRAAVDVVSLVDPSPLRHLRGVLRGLREPAVVVVAVTGPTAAQRLAAVPATLECRDDVPPEQLLRAVLRLSSR
ncbi:hypothetical protein [Geodermatophilus poikilotrophus]|uniref:Uncharacterized protein n=1 Tax=Geodermatophilus poikilotrophus TaxID=1333667 RepID=A0A1I0FCC0_9ACTN|nr:hypothetical protein [Geodermatophilus poikilotrophus]SET54993.1 hypothetical protein SAMN04488546_2850 [Geodermatophilus poikilotrophus]